MKQVLITGGSGLLGTKLTDVLLAKGYAVAHLSTNKNYSKENVACYYWNIKEKYIDQKSILNADVIIHLAGASIAGKKWTAKRKQEIIDSRVISSQILINALKNTKHNVKLFIGASAIGFYGDRGSELLAENAEPGTDFLAKVCEQWEGSYQLTDEIKKAVVRIGVVLSKDGGALPEMMKTLPFFIGILGNGKQFSSWIHIDDLAKLFVFIIENNLEGTYNAVAPNPLPQKDLAKIIAKQKNTIVMPTPKFALNLVLGEMKSLVLASQKCSANKIISKGFQFEFDKIDEALCNLR